jgi:hypothetical protein
VCWAQQRNAAVRLGRPCRCEHACTRVRLGAHGCRGVCDSNRGPNSAAKRRGGADRGSAMKTITGDSAGVRSSSGPNMHATGEAECVQECGLGPLPVGSGSSWPRLGSGRCQRRRQTGLSRPGTDACSCGQKPVARRALNGHKDGAPLPCGCVHEANLHGQVHGSAASKGATSRRGLAQGKKREAKGLALTSPVSARMRARVHSCTRAAFHSGVCVNANAPTSGP